MSAPGPGSAGHPPGGGPATVIVVQRVRPGQEEAFERWQERLGEAVASFAGLLGREVLTPAGDDDARTVLYRFDSVENLDRWLSSAVRRELVEEGTRLLEAPASQQVLVGQPEADPLTVVVSHPVRPQHEPEFLAWQAKIVAAQGAQPGFCGSRLYRPVPGIEENWTTVFSFDTAEHLDGWLDSPERAALLAAGEHFKDFDLRRLVTPFGSWFSYEDGGADSAPASWKTALSVLVGLYPTVMLITLGIREIWPHAPLWSSLLLGNLLSVSLLTWVVMPIVTRALGFWLAPASVTASDRLNVLGTLVSIAFLTVAAILFWLVTRVVWTLP